LRPHIRKPGTGIPDDGVIRVGCEHRRGSRMTLVYGLLPNERDVIGKELRRLCGTGGSAKDGIIMLQGDHRDTVISYFAQRQRRTKKMGG
jgi:translation initiation factor 1